MADGKVKLANIALRKIGANAISSFGENSDEARVLSDVYDTVRDEVLAEHPWSFAMKRVALTLSADVPAYTTDGLTVVYVKPSDMVRVFYTSVPCQIVVEENRILSDTRLLGVKYVYRNDNPATYYAQFITAFATRLAAEICFNLTESVKKAADLMAEYEKIRLPRAIQSDSQQGSPQEARADEWDIARLAGAGSQYFTPGLGQATWHPI